ncbi:unnamed protein product, partial [marine sediment metagenome]
MSIECTTVGIYTVDISSGVPTGYTWSTDNVEAVIVDGQGTPTVTIESTSDADVAFNLTIVVDYLGGDTPDTE